MASARWPVARPSVDVVMCNADQDVRPRRPAVITTSVRGFFFEQETVMSQRSLLTRDQSGSQFDARAVRALAAALTGSLLQPSDADYDRTRTVWNGMIDRRPGLIARCRNARDVAAA